MNLKKTSKFLSLILRHQPESVGIELDSNGWVDVDVLLRAMSRSGREISREQLEEVVRENDKQRFVIVNGRIRANQGHSVEIDLDLEVRQPPSILFHGTATRFLDGIMKEGLKKMSRQHVHLSSDQETARRVGARHGKSAIIEVNSEAMHAQEFEFYFSANGVWLVESVPAQFLKLLE